MAERPQVVLTYGLPASGKTTAATDWVSEAPRRARVCLDDIRGMLSVAWDRDVERVAQDTLVDAVERLVEQGLSVVVDNTHIERRLPNRLRHVFAGKVEWGVIDCTGVPAQDCIARDRRRADVGDRSVGRQVIEKMATRYEKNGHYLTVRWLADVPVPEPYDVNAPELNGQPRAVICDIDGTLAKMVARGPYEYEKYDTDELHKDVAEILAGVVRYLSDADDGDGYGYLLIVSGRDEEHYEVTSNWLHRNGIVHDGLFMRPKGDKRRDSVVKAELFDTYIRHNYRVLCVLDDRNQVVNECWRAMGLRTLQVADGRF